MFVCVLLCLCEYVGIGRGCVLIRRFTLFKVFLGKSSISVGLDYVMTLF